LHIITDSFAFVKRFFQNFSSFLFSLQYYLHFYLKNTEKLKKIYFLG